uniref:Leucine-rich repeat-containing protein 14 n=1 Tax=Catharus ustulatus TaxID=91951 RepID=A0A8C3Y000_CATUS
MDSLVFLCARRVVAQRPLPSIPTHLYPVLFQVVVLDGRPLVLRDLVPAWPFPVLNFQHLVGHRDPLGDHPCIDCDQAVIQGVVSQLQRELEEPSSDSGWVLGIPACKCWLRVLDMTGLVDSMSSHTPAWLTFWSRTKGLAKACVEQHKSRSGATTAVAALWPPGVDVHIDLAVDKISYGIVRDALQTGAAGPLRLKCREFHPRYISAFQIVTLLDSLDPSCLRRVKLHVTSLGLAELSVILPHLLRFPELRSLKLWNITINVQGPTPESASVIRDMAKQLGMLPCLRELNLGSARLPGNLHQILCNLQAPLESLELPFCSLVPADLAFLSQSIHAPALKRLNLSGLDVSEGLLEPLRLLLEKASASLLCLDLSYCHIADSHLAMLLPTLLRCSHLRFLRLYGNPLSTATIKDLLQKTLELLDLHLVVYPIPLDCHTLDPSEFDFDCFDESLDDKLFSATEAEISQLLENSGRTDLVWTDDPDHEDLDYFSL